MIPLFFLFHTNISHGCSEGKEKAPADEQQTLISGIEQLPRGDTVGENTVGAEFTVIGYLGKLPPAQIQILYTGTHLEHLRHIGDPGHVPVSDIGGGQIGAVGEHGFHILNIGNIPSTDIRSPQNVAGIKHPVHGNNAGSVQILRIHLFKMTAQMEHILHAGSIFRVEGISEGDFRYISAGIKQHVAGHLSVDSSVTGKE